MRSRSSAFSTRSSAQAVSASRFIASIAPCSLARSSSDLRSCSSSRPFSDLIASVADWCRFSASAKAARRSASARCATRSVVAQLVGYELPVGKKTSLLIQLGCELLYPARQHLEFGFLDDELAFKLADPIAQLLGACAFLGEMAAQSLRLTRFVAQSFLEQLAFPFIAFDLSLQRLGLRAQCDELDALAVCRAGTFVNIRRELSNFCLGIGQRALRLLMSFCLCRKLGAEALQLLGQLPFLRLERKHRRGFFAKLQLEPPDRIAFFADLGELTRGLRLQLLDAHFQSPRRHGKLGAQLVLLGLNLGE